MDKKFQEKCKQLVVKYKGYKNRAWKAKTRNRLYREMSPWMLKWVKSILHSWHKWENENEILALSWDAYCFCLEYYKNLNVPLPSHFFDYTRYFLLNEYAKRDSVELPLEELKETLSLIKTDLNISFIELLTIKQYMDKHVPKKHYNVFYDAMQSLSENHKERTWKWKTGCGLSQQSYNELKKVYRSVILFLYNSFNKNNR